MIKYHIAASINLPINEARHQSCLVYCVGRNVLSFNGRLLLKSIFEDNFVI